MSEASNGVEALDKDTGKCPRNRKELVGAVGSAQEQMGSGSCKKRQHMVK